ncbi:MAG: hypothetical protein Q9174_004595 [Haloplaca sp. 1 TL-2023]
MSTGHVRFAPASQKTKLTVLSAALGAESNRKYIKKGFCDVFCTSNQQEGDIGVLIDEMNHRQAHKVYRAKTIRGLQTSSRSLEDLLRSAKHSGDESLSRKERLGIAVILASSVLQLDGTSWLKSGWSSNDIYFHHKDGQDTQFAQPYLAWQKCCDANRSCRTKSLSGVANHMIRNEVLLALGLTLVELCFGKTLDDMRKPEDIGTDKMAIRLATATRLYYRVNDEMGIPYGDVVRRCLYQTFDVRVLSLDIEEVQQKVLEEVVTPLVNALNDFNGVWRGFRI